MYPIHTDRRENIMAKSIKIMDGLKVITSNEIIELREGGFPALWKYFGWDIENDPNADACATEITRQLICFGRVDLSEWALHSSTLIVEVIPCEDTITVKKAR